MAMIFVALLVGAHAYGQAEVTLRKELNILKPFVGKTWICEWIVETRDPPGRLEPARQARSRGQFIRREWDAKRGCQREFVFRVGPG